MPLEQDARVRSVVDILPLTIRKAARTIPDTDAHTRTAQAPTSVGERQHAVTPTFRIPRKPVAVPSTAPRIGRPTSGSAIDGYWLDSSLDAMLAASRAEESRAAPPVTESPRTSPTNSVSAINEHAISNQLDLINRPIHPACLRPGVLATGLNPGALQYLIPPEDRAAVPRNQPGTLPLHALALVEARRLKSRAARGLGREPDGPSIPAYDPFVEGRPLVETISVWREQLHGFRNS